MPGTATAASTAATPGEAGAAQAEQGASAPGTPLPPLEPFLIPLAAPATLDDLARMAGLQSGELLALNLALGPDRRHEVYRGLYYDKPLSEVLRTLPTKGVGAPAGYVLTLPAGSRDAFLRAYLPRAVATGARKVRVRRGDTLWSLARKHGLTVEQLALFNGLSSESKLRAGARLAIPDSTASPEATPEHLDELVTLAHRAESARLGGHPDEAVRLYAALAHADPRGYLGAHARREAPALVRRIARSLRYGLNGKRQDSLRAAALLAGWLASGDGRTPVPDADGRLRLAWARALIASDDGWRARRVLEALHQDGQQRSAARALLATLEPTSLSLHSVALQDARDSDLTALRLALNPDPVRFEVAVEQIPDLTACVRTGDTIGLKGGSRAEMTWPAEPWCGSLPALQQEVVASLGEGHALDLGRSPTLRFSLPARSKVPLRPRPAGETP